MSDPLHWLDAALADQGARGLRRTLAERSSAQRGDRVVIDCQSLVNFGSNDYLGLAADPRIVAAVKAAVAEHGWGSGASPLVTGHSSLHAQLERELAEFEGTEAALLFPSGYAANVGTITALVGKGDTIYSDELNHASIIDGCRLSGAAIFVYRHGDARHLSQLLSDRPPVGRRLVVTDSLFSMGGDLAPLRELADRSREQRAMLLVDEAHATGVLGAQGRGACELANVDDDVSVRVGTLSKALGSIGGFVAGSQKLIDWLANRSRPYFFSTALPAAAAAAGLAALRIVREQPEQRLRLQSMSRELAARLLAAGLIRLLPPSQIIPIVIGEPERTVSAAAELRRRGFFVPAIRPPSVPKGQSLLRISLTSLHTEQQIDDLVAALRDAIK